MRNFPINQTPDRGRRQSTGGGFTMIELATVLVVISVMAAVAVPTLSSLASTRSAFAARLIFKDLTLVRERAVATGRPQYVVFAPLAETYTFLSENPANPGRANATIATDPSSGRPFIRTLGIGDTAGVDIVTAVFDGSAEVGFDWKGRPLNSAQAPLAATGTVTLSGGRIVQVLSGSGLVTTNLQ